MTDHFLFIFDNIRDSVLHVNIIDGMKPAVFFRETTALSQTKKETSATEICALVFMSVIPRIGDAPQNVKI